jgi:excinuclease ABC subunit A
MSEPTPAPVAPSNGVLVVRGARTHNLKGVDLTLPHRRLIVFTGVSGSGKSSLAFDTIYAEGQRRYVESLSAYARQFLERMEKPDVDGIEGIAPAIAIRQKNSIRNPRSTVGTTTEIHDYLRLLWARVGRTMCRQCGKAVERESPDVVAAELLKLPTTRSSAPAACSRAARRSLKARARTRRVTTCRSTRRTAGTARRPRTIRSRRPSARCGSAASGVC